MMKTTGDEESNEEATSGSGYFSRMETFRASRRARASRSSAHACCSLCPESSGDSEGMSRPNVAKLRYEDAYSDGDSDSDLGLGFSNAWRRAATSRRNRCALFAASSIGESSSSELSSDEDDNLERISSTSFHEDSKDDSLENSSMKQELLSIDSSTSPLGGVVSSVTFDGASSGSGDHASGSYFDSLAVSSSEGDLSLFDSSNKVDTLALYYDAQHKEDELLQSGKKKKRPSRTRVNKRSVKDADEERVGAATKISKASFDEDMDTDCGEEGLDNDVEMDSNSMASGTKVRFGSTKEAVAAAQQLADSDDEENMYQAQFRQRSKLCLQGVTGIEKGKVSSMIVDHGINDFTLRMPHKSHAFLTVLKDDEKKIIRALNSTTFEGRTLRVERANQEHQPPHVSTQSPQSAGQKLPRSKQPSRTIRSGDRKRSRLSWAPDTNADQRGLDAEDSSDSEEHSSIQQMKIGGAETLVNAVVQVSIGAETYQAVVLSVADSMKYSYNISKFTNEGKQKGDGTETTIELDPTSHGLTWSIIGKKGSRGRISMNTTFFDSGKVNATGARQGSSTFAKMGHATPKISGGINTPAVVRQGRTIYAKTPKTGSKRQNDLKNHARYALRKASKEWFPEKSPASRMKVVEKALDCGSKKDDTEGLKAIKNLASFMGDTMKDQQPKKRRPTMAFFAGTKGLKRADAEKHLGFSISADEWWKAKQHALHPGAGEPVRVVKSSRQRVTHDQLLEMIGLVDDNHLQRVAFGVKDIHTVHGNTIQIDAVQTTDSIANIARDYYNKMNPDGLKRAEHQCKKKHRETRHYCRLDEGHEGRCKFTPEEALSAETLRKFLKAMTTGQQKSYAGLDDEMVYKGTNNFKRLQEIFELLAMGMVEGERNEMKERIENARDFHRAEFRFHVTDDEASRCCQCIPCGFHSEEEPISCPKGGHHEEACHDCEDSFQVISELKRLANEAQNREGLTKEEIESFIELENEIETCRQNLIEYRSHIVRRKAEGAFQKEQLRMLRFGDVIVIFDYKMKINPLYHREAQKMWYGKRGTSCLGVLIYTKSDVEGEVNAEYLYFFSDDTCQDANLVLKVKSYVYSEYIPTLFPDGTKIKVKFESDGAGCFHCSLMKLCQPLWYVWTDGQVEEVQIRHSVNGDGKSCLDGSFGLMTQHFVDFVNSGGDITNAITCLKAFIAGPSIKNGTGFVLHSDRANDLQAPSNIDEPLLLSSHRLVLDREAKVVTCYTHSGFGEGRTIPLSRYEELLPSTTTMMPQYRITGEEDNIYKEDVTHSIEMKTARDAKTNTTRRANKRMKCEEAFWKDINEAKESGLFKCTQRREVDLAPCRKRFMSERELENHLRSGKHNYTGQDMILKSAGLLSGEGGALAVGSRKNRNEANYSDERLKDGSGAGTSDGSEWKEPGCYRRGAKKKPTQKSLRLINELASLFRAGEDDTIEKKGRTKYTPQQAQDHLRGMRNPSGLRTFSSTSIYGDVPTLEQIKHTFAKFKRAGIPGEVDCDEEDMHMHMDMMLDGIIVGGNNQLKDIRFYLDGGFEDDALVKSTIEEQGGKVLDKWSKKTNFIVQGRKPTKKSGMNGTTRFTNWERLQLLVKGDIYMEDLGTTSIIPLSVKTKSATASKKKPPPGKFSGTRFFLDSGVEKKDYVKSIIHNNGGIVMQRKSKNTDYIVQGTQKKSASNSDSSISITSWERVQQFLNDEISLQDLPSVQSSTSPASNKFKDMRFFLDSGVEKKDYVKSIIHNNGGIVMQRKSKNTDYIVQGTQKKSASNSDSSISITSWERVQQFLNDEISLQDLPSVQSSTSPASDQFRGVLEGELPSCCKRDAMDDDDAPTSTAFTASATASKRIIVSKPTGESPQKKRGKLDDQSDATGASAAEDMACCVCEGSPSYRCDTCKLGIKREIFLLPYTLCASHGLSHAAQPPEDWNSPLAGVDKEIVREAIYGQGGNNDVLSVRGGDSVKRGSMRRLKEGLWLNDELITYFLKHCLKLVAEGVASPTRRRWYVFNSYFIQTLFDDKNKNQRIQGVYNFKNVSRWSKKVPGEDIFSMDFLFFAINAGNAHWMSVCVFFALKKIIYFDSKLPKSGDLDSWSKTRLLGIAQYIEDEYESKYSGAFDWEGWQLVRSKPPQQGNDNDCGVYTCLFGHFIVNGWEFRFDDGDAAQFRERIALSILSVNDTNNNTLGPPMPQIRLD